MVVREDRRQLNKGWFSKLLRGQPHIVLMREGSNDIYMKRWFLIPRNGHLNLYLHKFEGSDEDRALHDHPWWFISWLVKGSYLEHGLHGWMKQRKAGSIAYRPAEWTHRVELYREEYCYDMGDGHKGEGDEKPVWTVILTGPKRREWGFHCPKGWVHWQDFVSGPDGTQSKGCGEFA